MNSLEGAQGFYSDFYNSAETVSTGDVGARVLQRVIILKKTVTPESAPKLEELVQKAQESFSNLPNAPVVQKIPSTNGQNETWLIHIKLEDLLDVDDVTTLCTFGVLGKNEAKGQDTGISYTELVTLKEQNVFAGQIKQICEEEKQLLQYEKDLLMDIGIIGMFSDTRTDNTPFERTAPLRDIDTSLHGELVTSSGTDPNGNTYQTKYPTLSWVYPDRGIDQKTGLAYTIDNNANPLLKYISNDNEDPDDVNPAPRPAFVAANENPVEPSQDERESTREGCPKLLNGECETSISDYKATENKPELKDPSFLGTFGYMKETTSYLNDYSLMSGCATRTFGAVPLPSTEAGGNQFLVYDPGSMLNEYGSSYDEGESSNESIETQIAEITRQSNALVDQIIHETPCGEYKRLSQTTSTALNDIDLCNQKRQKDLEQQLFLAEQSYKQETIQKAWQKESTVAEQFKTELGNMDKTIKSMGESMKRISEKRKMSFLIKLLL